MKKNEKAKNTKTVTVEVEKKLSWWQSLKMETGGISLGVLLVVLIYFVVKIVKAG